MRRTSRLDVSTKDDRPAVDHHRSPGVNALQNTSKSTRTGGPRSPCMHFGDVCDIDIASNVERISGLLIAPAEQRPNETFRLTVVIAVMCAQRTCSSRMGANVVPDHHGIGFLSDAHQQKLFLTRRRRSSYHPKRVQIIGRATERRTT